MGEEIRSKSIEFRQATPTPTMQDAPTGFKSPSQTIGAIVRGFKSSATKQVNELRKMPRTKLWQRNYWDHIVRNEPELNRICEYIRNNPTKWASDRLCDTPPAPGTENKSAIGMDLVRAYSNTPLRENMAKYNIEPWMV